MTDPLFRFPHRVVIERMDWDIIEQWCVANIGEFDQTWYKLGIDTADWVINGNHKTQWFFKRQQDATFFKLRWA